MILFLIFLQMLVPRVLVWSLLSTVFGDVGSMLRPQSPMAHDAAITSMVSISVPVVTYSSPKKRNQNKKKEQKEEDLYEDALTLLVVADSAQKLYFYRVGEDVPLVTVQTLHQSPVKQITSNMGASSYLMTGSLDGSCEVYEITAWFEATFITDPSTNRRRSVVEPKVGVQLAVQLPAQASEPPPASVSETCSASQGGSSEVVNACSGKEVASPAASVVATMIYQRLNTVRFGAAYSDGYLRFFTQNGTFHSELDTKNETVLSATWIQDRNEILYATEVGLGTAKTGSKLKPTLSNFCTFSPGGVDYPMKITSLAVHGTRPDVTFLSSDQGIIYQIKPGQHRKSSTEDKKFLPTCEFAHQYQVQGPNPGGLSLDTMRGYLFAASSNSLYVFNSTKFRRAPKLVSEHALGRNQDTIISTVIGASSDLVLVADRGGKTVESFISDLPFTMPRKSLLMRYFRGTPLRMVVFIVTLAVVFIVGKKFWAKSQLKSNSREQSLEELGDLAAQLRKAGMPPGKVRELLGKMQGLGNKKPRQFDRAPASSDSHDFGPRSPGEDLSTRSGPVFSGDPIDQESPPGSQDDEPLDEAHSPPYTPRVTVSEDEMD